MSATEIRSDLDEGLVEMVRWLRNYKLPMPPDFKLSGAAPVVSQRGADLKLIQHALDCGADYLVTNREVCAVKDFGPIRLAYYCHRWDTRSVPPSDRCAAVAA